MKKNETEGMYDYALAAMRRVIKGYHFSEEKTVYVSDSAGNRVVKECCVTKKYSPPELDAIIFVLTNRMPSLWRNKPSEQQNENSDTGERPDLSKLSENTLKEISGLCK